MRIHPALLLLALLPAACGASDGPAHPEDPAPADSFTGTIVWKADAGGEDEEGADMFLGLAMTEIRAAFGENRVRLEELGGINAGVLLLTREGPEAAWEGIRLDPKKETWEAANWVNDLHAAGTKLEATGESTEVCGRPVEKYRVTESEAVPDDAVVHVWLDGDLRLPELRLEADFETSRMNPPLVLSFPGVPGAVLKAEILQNDILVTWVATEITPGAPDPASFEVPEGYRDAER